MSPRLKMLAVLPAALLLAALALPAFGPGSGGALGAGYRAVGAWTPLSVGGFGAGAADMAATPFAEFSGDLYCGVATQSGAEVRKLVGTSWNLVNTPGFGTTDNSAISSLEAYGGYLYAGTANMDGCEVWRYNGTTWAKVVGSGTSAGPGFGSSGNIMASCMEASGGMLYVGTTNINYSVFPVRIWSNGGEVWSFDGAVWTRDASPGFGDDQNVGITAMKEYAGALYAGTARASISVAVPEIGDDYAILDITVEGVGCELRKRNGYNDWGLVDERGFGSPSNAALTVMEVYGGDLVLGTTNGGAFVSLKYYFSGDMDIEDFSWHSDGCCVYAYDGSVVTDLVTGGFGDADNAVAFASTAVSVSGTDVLMMGVVGVSGTNINDFYTRASLRGYNGTDWYHAAPDGFGSERNKAVSALYTRSGQVYAGTLNPEDGCETWLGMPPDEPLPFIQSIEASAAKIGSQVVISGEYFGAVQGASTVVFADEVEAQVLAWSDTSITCVVPSGAVRGDVVVRTAKGESNNFWFEVEGYVWYLAEGSTDGGMETWVLVQNPGTEQVTVDLTLMTGSGPVSPPALQNVPVPAASRRTFPIHAYVTTYDVSTMVLAEGGPVICERAMYGGDRTWAHDSIGVTVPGEKWYLAEGCTGGDFETFVLVQNPGFSTVTVDLTFMTGAGPVAGPQDYAIAPGSRHTFKANDYVTDWDVSTMVAASGGEVICERAMYGNARSWAHDSIGVTASGTAWYLAEGCTGGDFETWVLVQNPGSSAVTVDLTFMTGSGPVAGPQDYSLPAGSRHTFRVNDYVTDYDVSTMVTSSGGKVICERAMYGGNRTWGHDSVGVTAAGSTWYLAEGCTGGDFETWVLVQNPGSSAVTVDLTFMTGSGPVAGPQDYSIPAGSRHTFLVNAYVIDYDVSTMVTSSGGPVICERAMYGGNRTWAHDSIGLDP